MVNIFSSIIAAIGRQLKQSVNVFHNLMLYRRLPESEQEGETQNFGRATDPLTFIIKPVYPIDTGTFMISTQDEEVLRIFDLVSEKKTYSLQRLFASVNIIAQEKIIRLRWEASILEQA